MTGGSERLSVQEKVGFAVGDAAGNIYFQTFLLFLLYFYTDVVGLSASAVATMFMVTRIWDAVNDPLMGTVADRTNTRWGKFRPYLLWLAVPVGVLGVLTFTTPEFGSTGKLVYAYVTYNLLMMAYTAINVPYSALMGVITPNSLERTEISSYRFVAAFVGSLVVQGSTLWLVTYFGEGNDAVGWQWAMACLSALAVVLFLVTFATTKERVAPPPGQQHDLRGDLRALFRNTAWLLIAGATVFQLFFIVVRNSSIVYYFKYYVQDQQTTLFGRAFDLSFETLSSYFLLSGSILTILGVILTPWFARKMDKGTAYVTFLGISAVGAALYYVLSPRDLLLIFALNLVISFAWGPVSVLQWAMYTDAADHGEWKNGRRTTGLVMAASLFALKLGLALGGAFVGWILAYHGFVANEAQTSETLEGIRRLMSLYPAALGAIGAALMLWYPLTNRMMVQIEQDLTARR